jgi:hypothetical protein
MTQDEKLKEMMNWAPSALAQIRALNEHYAKSMSPILNKTEEEILKELLEISQENYLKIKAKIQNDE